MNGDRFVLPTPTLVAKESADAAPTPESAARTEARPNAGNRAWELLLVGGSTLALFPLAWLARRAVGLDTSEYAVGFATFYGAYLINDPHFAVTYLLFYRDVRRRALSPDVPRAQRIRYWVAGLLVPVALAVWAGCALRFHSAEALGAMVQLMFLLVGWHYAKQGFGVLSVLAARRGARFTARERAVLLGHCFAGWAYAWASPAAPAGDFEEKGVVYRALAHPRWLETLTGAALVVSTATLVAVVFAMWRRARNSFPAGPLAVFLVTIWAWTIYSSIDPLIRYLIPALHSIQYLYFVWLLRRNEARAAEGPPTFGRPAAVRVGALAVSALTLGWVFFHAAPALLNGLFVPPLRRGSVPDALGETPYFAAIFVVVNVHHYFMDHVIWRRENPDTRFLREA